jgi:hypothetical protein
MSPTIRKNDATSDTWTTRGANARSVPTGRGRNSMAVMTGSVAVNGITDQHLIKILEVKVKH